MINPTDNNIEWTPLANDEMGLMSMINRLYENKLMDRYEERLNRHQPFRHYEELFKEHNELLEDIVKIFFPTGEFTPSSINQQGTAEYYMWNTINSIFYIVWYNNIEDSSNRGYETISKDLDDARLYLSGFANSTAINQLINFPKHRNETIQNLNDYFVTINRVQTGEKIIPAIKEYFGIKKVTSTKKKKMIDANKQLQERIKETHNLTDEELYKFPIIGQLQTKI